MKKKLIRLFIAVGLVLGVGKTGVFRMLIACTDIIDDVQRHHLRTGILVMHQTQAIGETMFVYFHTQWMKMWQKSIIPSQSLS